MGSLWAVFLALSCLQIVCVSGNLFANTSIHVNEELGNEDSSLTSITFTAQFLHNFGPDPDDLTGFKVNWETKYDPNANPDQGVQALPGVDYVQSSGDFRFPTGANGASASFSVDLLNDNTIEPVEYFNVYLSVETTAPWAAVQITSPAAKGYIADEEDGTCLIQDSEKVEGVDEEFQFDIVMSHPIDTDLSLRYRTRDIIGATYHATASNASGYQDYFSTSGDLLFPQSSTENHFTVKINNDNLQEHTETYEVQITIPPGFGRDLKLINEGVAKGVFAKELEHCTVYILDEMIAEGDSTEMVFTAYLSHPVDTDFSVRISTADGVETSTKIPAVKFTGPTSGGQYSPAEDVWVIGKHTPVDLLTHQFNVQVHNDNVQSPNSKPVDEAVYGRVNYRVQYTLDAAVWKGSTGGAENDWQLTVNGSNDQTGYAFGYQYDQENATISIGDSTSQPEDTSVGWVFTTRMSHPAAVAGQAHGVGFYYVDNNADASTATIETTTPRGGCKGASAGVDACWPQFVLPSPNPNPTKFFFTDNQEQQITFAAGPDDQILEGEETFMCGIELDPVTSSGYSTSLATDKRFGVGTIQDDDTGTFTYDVDQSTLAEGESNSFRITVRLSHTSARLVTMSAKTEDITAVSTQDYEAVADVLVWPALSAPGFGNVVEIVISNDNVQEEEETLKVIFSEPTPTEWFSQTPVERILTITDNEHMTCKISSMTEAQDESAPDWTFTASLSHPVSVDLTVPWITEVNPASGPTAVDASRFEQPVGATVTFASDPEGRRPPPTAPVPVVVYNDNVQQQRVEIDVQTFSVKILPDGQSPVALIDVASAQDLADTVGVAMVSDNERPTIHVNDVTGQEGQSQPFTFTVSMSHKSTITVCTNYTTAVGPVDNPVNAQYNGTSATGRRDFVSVNGEVCLAAGLKTSPIVVTILNDPVQELTEQFSLELSVDADGDVLTPVDSGFVITRNIGVGYIEDFENCLVTIGDMSGMEPSFPTSPSAGLWNFTVQSSCATSTPVTARYRAVPHSAILPGNGDLAYDFSLVSTAVNPEVTLDESSDGITFDHGEIAVRINDDYTQEKTETFGLILDGTYSPIAFQLRIETDIEGVGTIDDFENATCAISDAGRFDKDVTDFVVFTVSMSHKLSYDGEVAYKTEDGTALAVNDLGYGDYFAETSSVTFPKDLTAGAASSTQDIDIDLNRDFCQHAVADRTFSVDLTSCPPSIAEEDASGEASVYDDQDATVFIGDTSAAEGDTLKFPVTMSHCVAQDVDIFFNVEGVTAVAGLDFVVPPNRNTKFSAYTSPVPQIITLDVNTINNNVQSLNKSLEVSFEIINGNPLNVRITRFSGLGRILDYEHPTVAITPQVSGKDTDDFIFEISMSHPVTTDISVIYFTTDGSAVSTPPDPDFDAIGQTLHTFPGGVDPVPALVDVNVIAKNASESSAIFLLFYVNITEGNPAVWNTYTVKLANDVGQGAIEGDSDQTTLTVSSFTGPEDIAGGHFTFTATLRDRVGEDMSIDVVGALDSGVDPTEAALPGIDFDDTPQTITFAGRQPPNQTVSFDINVYDDWLEEKTERFLVVLQEDTLSPAAWRGSVLIGSPGVGTIEDNDHAMVIISDANADEGGVTGSDTVNLTFTVSMSHPTWNDRSVSLNFGQGTAAGTNVVPPDGKGNPDSADYLRSIPSTLSFDGRPTFTQGDSPSISFGVIVYNDNWQELTETVTVLITDSNIPINKSTGTGFILDDEGCTMHVPDVSGPEGSQFVLVATLSHPITAQITTNYTTEDGTANSVDDYDAKTGTITFQRDDLVRQIAVQSIDNDILQGEVYFYVNFTAFLPSETNVHLDHVPKITIDADDEECTMIWTDAAGDEATEDNLVFTLALSHKVNVPVVVDVETLDGTAHANGLNGPVPDYETVKTTITFDGTTAGQTLPVGVKVNNDNIQEIDETFVVTATVVSPDYPITVVNQATGTIHDFEDLTVDCNDVLSTEGSDVGLVFTIQASHPTDPDLVVSFHTTDPAQMLGAATATLDYSPYADGSTVVLLRNLTVAQHVEISSSVVDDRLTEGTETFSLDIVGDNHPEMQATYVHPHAEATILDNDFGTLQILTTDAHEVDQLVNVTVHFSHPCQYDVELLYRTAPGTANDVDDPDLLQNIDFVTVASGTSVTVPALTTELHLQVMLVDDYIQELDEFFSVLIDQVLPGLFTIDSGIAQVNLIDDFENTTICVHNFAGARETEPVFYFDTIMSHPSQSTVVAVSYGFRDGTAIGGKDFDNTPGEVDFQRSVTIGPQLVQIAVDIYDDDVEESIEYFYVLIDGFAPDTFNAEVVCDEAQGFIDERLNGENATLSIDDPEGVEGSAIMFTISLSHSTSQDVEVGYRTFAGSAIPGEDFVAVESTVTFPKDVPIVGGVPNTQKVQVDTNDDIIVEPSQTFSMEIFLPSVSPDYPIHIDKSVGVATIMNNDVGTIVLRQIDVDEKEGAEAVFPVQFSNPVQGQFQFTYNTLDASAQSGVQYVGVTDGTFVSTSMTVAGEITIALINDDIQREEFSIFDLRGSDIEYLGANFNPAHLQFAVGGDQALCRIADREGLTVFVPGDMTVPESYAQPVFRFQFSMSHRISVANEVNYVIQELTALEGLDWNLFEQNPNPLEFSNCMECLPGPQAAALLTIIDDDISEVTWERIRFVLTSATPNTVRVASAPDDAGFLNIEDDDDAVISIGDFTGTEVGIFDFAASITSRVDALVSFRWETQNTFPEPSPVSPSAWGTPSGDVQLRPIPGTGLSELLQPDYRSRSDSEFFPVLDSRDRILQVEMVDDFEQECDETFGVAITQLTVAGDNPNGDPHFNHRVYLASGGGVGVGHIVNDDEHVTIKMPNQTVNEGAGEVRFTLQLSHPVDRVTSFTWETQVETAGINRYDSNAGGSLQILAHRPDTPFSRQDIIMPVSVVDDVIAQPDQSFGLHVHDFVSINATGECNALTGVPSGTGDAHGTIEDNEQSTIVVKDLAANENIGGDPANPDLSVFAIEVAFSHPNSDAFTVDWERIDVTTNANDFAEDFPYVGVVTFPAQQQQPMQVQAIDILVKIDKVVELDEVFNLDISNIPSYVNQMGSKLTSVNTILNVDHCTIEISSEPIAIEQAGEFVFKMVASNAVDVQYMVEYTSVVLTGSSIPSGQTSVVEFFGEADETVFGVVTVLKDSIVELSETFRVNVELEQTEGRSISFVGDTPFFFGTIDNDDVAVVNCADVSGPESSGAFVFTITMDNPVDVNVVLTYRTEDFEAVSTGTNADYVTTNGVATFVTGGPLQIPVSVVILDDQIVETDQSFRFVLSNLNAQGRAVSFPGGSDSLTVLGTIENNDVGTATIMNGVDEESQTIQFIVKMSHAAEGQIDFNFATQDGSAVAGKQYTAPAAPNNVGFVPRLTLAGNVFVATLPYAPVTGNKTFTLRLSNWDTHGLDVTLVNDVARGTIIDTSVALLYFCQNSYSGLETSDVIVTVCTDTVVEISTFGCLFSTLIEGSAVPGVHYTPQRDSQVNFVGGGSTVATASITVDLIATSDTIEPTTTFLGELSEPFPTVYSANFQIDPQGRSATIQRVDPEPAVLTFRPEQSKVVSNENTPFTVFFEWNKNIAVQSITAAYETQDITAIGGVDYNRITGVMQWSASGGIISKAQSKTLQVTVVPDGSNEPLEQLQLAVLSISASATISAGVKTSDNVPVVLSIYDPSLANTGPIVTASACMGAIGGVSKTPWDATGSGVVNYINGFPIVVDFAHCFYDFEGDALTYSQIGLPPAFVFDGSTLRLDDSIPASDETTFFVTVKDAFDLEATLTVTLNRFGEPQVGVVLGQYAAADNIVTKGSYVRTSVQQNSAAVLGDCVGIECCQVVAGAAGVVQDCVRQGTIVHSSVMIASEGIFTMCYGTEQNDHSNCPRFVVADVPTIIGLSMQSVQLGETISVPINVFGGTQLSSTNPYNFRVMEPVNTGLVRSTDIGFVRGQAVLTFQAGFEVPGTTTLHVFASDQYYTVETVVEIVVYSRACN